MRSALRFFSYQLISAYGSFLFFRDLKANLLIIAATFIHPHIGPCGLVCGMTALLALPPLFIPDHAASLATVSCVLVGLLVGACFAMSPFLFPLALVGGVFALLVTRFLQDRLGLAGLPVMSSPFCLTGVLVFAMGKALGLAPAPL